MSLTNELSFDDLLEKTMQVDRTHLHMNGYAAGALEIKMTPHPFKKLSRPNLPPYTEIDVCGFPIADSHLEDLKGLPLTELRLAQTEVKTLAPLRGMKTLKLLNASDNSLNHEAMVTVSQLPNLWALDLSNTPIQGKDLLLLKNLPKLRSVQLSGCKNVSENDIMQFRRQSAAKNLIIAFTGDDYPQAIRQVNVLARARHFNEADSHLENLFHYWKSTNPMNTDWLCRGYGTRAELFMDRGDVQKAQESLQTAMKYGHTKGVKATSLAEVCNIQGSLYSSMKNNALAEKAYQQSYEILSSNEGSPAYINTFKLAALIGKLKAQQASGEKEGMLASLNKIDKLWDNLDMSIDQLIQSKMAVGVICVSIGSNERACRLFKSADSMFASMAAPTSASRIQLRQLIEQTCRKKSPQ